MLFGTSVVFLLLTYIPMFPAFLNLRKNDPNRERIFTFPFKGTMMKVMLAIPCIELVLAIVATLVPFSVAEIGDKVPMIVIFIVLVLIGEVVRVVSAKGRETEYKGLTPSWLLSVSLRRPQRPKRTRAPGFGAPTLLIC